VKLTTFSLSTQGLTRVESCCWPYPQVIIWHDCCVRTSEGTNTNHKFVSSERKRAYPSQRIAWNKSDVSETTGRHTRTWPRHRHSPPPPLRPLNKPWRQIRAILDKEKLLFNFQSSVYSSKTVFCPCYLHRGREITTVTGTRVYITRCQISSSYICTGK
jgi:hypothetical protein